MTDHPSLLVISSAPGRMVGELLELDRKFVDGMTLYAQGWDGPVACLLRAPGAADPPAPFAGRYDAADLPFAVHLRPADHRITAADLAGHDAVLASGDNADYLHLADLPGLRGKLFYTIENILQTRRQIVQLDRSRSWPRRLRSLWWLAGQERRRRAAFARAAGVQANGAPAYEAYRGLNPATLMYLDNRMDAALLATPAERAARAARLAAGAPLRLIHSGRLEPMKGSQDLIPVMLDLRARGVTATLDIFGAGSLESELSRAVATHGLGDRVRLHGAVDYATALVPFARQNADIFLSCHRQSDPSCSYLENMGCGLAVVGYDNRMWAALSRDSRAGWTAPLGRPAGLAACIAAADADRAGLAATCGRAHDFAARHLFAGEFARRLEQMRAACGAA